MCGVAAQLKDRMQQPMNREINQDYKDRASAVNVCMFVLSAAQVTEGFCSSRGYEGKSERGRKERCGRGRLGSDVVSTGCRNM